MMEALKQANALLTPMDYMGFAVALIGLGVLLGWWMFKLTERPILVLMLDLMRDIQRADRTGRWLPFELRARVDRLIGKRSLEEQAEWNATEDRGYGPEQRM